MPSTTAGHDAICPFFKRAQGTEIVCECAAPKADQVMRFRAAGAKQAWMDTRCCTYAYRSTCPQAALMFRLYEKRRPDDMRTLRLYVSINDFASETTRGALDALKAAGWRKSEHAGRTEDGAEVIYTFTRPAINGR